MPILPRTQESCRDIYPLCTPMPAGPGPAMNAASAKGDGLQGIPFPDPTNRDPSAALSAYMSETRPELIVGILLVIVIAAIGVGVCFRYNKNARYRFKKYWAMLMCRFNKNYGAPQLPPSPVAGSDVSSVSTRVDENTMRTAPTTIAQERPTLSRAPEGSQLSVLKTEQLAMLPSLLSRP